jgi:hypothetical protein
MLSTINPNKQTVKVRLSEVLTAAWYWVPHTIHRASPIRLKRSGTESSNSKDLDAALHRAKRDRQR